MANKKTFFRDPKKRTIGARSAFFTTLTWHFRRRANSSFWPLSTCTNSTSSKQKQGIPTGMSRAKRPFWSKKGRNSRTCHRFSVSVLGVFGVGPGGQKLQKQTKKNAVKTHFVSEVKKREKTRCFWKVSELRT